ncbi:Glutaredoxin [Capsicum annuum]|nr:Glutaredoxin [Capsicum annuum]
MEMALTKAKQIVSSNPVVVFSKTYCGYCTRVKQLLSQLGATFKVIELDRERSGEGSHHKGLLYAALPCISAKGFQGLNP